MASMDIFNGSAFTATELTARYGKFEYVPQVIAKLGLFETKGVRTTTFFVERRDGALALIPNTHIDAPAQQWNGNKRDVYQFTVSRFPLQRVIRPSEIQNVRGFGSESELESVMGVVAEKVDEMKPNHLATLEWQRIGAIRGTVLDADGSTVIENLYTRFGISQTDVDFELDDTATAVRTKCLTVKRTIEAGLGGLTYDGVIALCGKDFFDGIIEHADVKEAYANYATNKVLRDDPRFEGFEFAGITFREYRGNVSGNAYIPDAEAYFVPVGVPGMFITRFAPADMLEFVNTAGLPMYVSQEVLPHGKGVDILTESLPMSINLRPEAVVKGHHH